MLFRSHAAYCRAGLTMVCSKQETPSPGSIVSCMCLPKWSPETCSLLKVTFGNARQLATQETACSVPMCLQPRCLGAMLSDTKQHKAQKTVRILGVPEGQTLAKTRLLSKHNYGIYLISRSSTNRCRHCRDGPKNAIPSCIGPHSRNHAQ